MVMTLHFGERKINNLNFHSFMMKNNIILHFKLILHSQICNIIIVPNRNSCNYFVYFCVSSSINRTCVELKVKDVCFFFFPSSSLGYIYAEIQKMGLVNSIRVGDNERKNGIGCLTLKTIK